MNRTQKLMAGVAAAMAMFGSKDVLLTAATIEARGEQTSTESKKAPPDNSPNAAAAAILPKLDVLQSKALTVDELHKRLPDIARACGCRRRKNAVAARRLLIKSQVVTI